MTRLHPPSWAGKEEGNGSTWKKRVLPPTPSCKIPPAEEREDGGQDLNVESAAPRMPPDTLNPKQVVATTLQAVWHKGWDQGPIVTVEADKSKTLHTTPEQLQGPQPHLLDSISTFLSARVTDSFGFQKPLSPSSGFTTALHPEAGLAGKTQLLRRCSSQQHQRGRSPALLATE